MVDFLAVKLDTKNHKPMKKDKNKEPPMENMIFTRKQHREVGKCPRPTQIVGGAFDIEHYHGVEVITGRAPSGTAAGHSRRAGAATRPHPRPGPPPGAHRRPRQSRTTPANLRKNKQGGIMTRRSSQSERFEHRYPFFDMPDTRTSFYPKAVFIKRLLVALSSFVNGSIVFF